MTVSRGVVLGLVLVLANASAFGATKHVVCRNVTSGASWSIAINDDKQTVDDFPASFSGDEVAWFDFHDSGHYILDRATGSLIGRFASSTGGYSLTHHCDVGGVKAQARH
jgi:hypothetical protein